VWRPARKPFRMGPQMSSSVNQRTEEKVKPKSKWNTNLRLWRPCPPRRTHKHLNPLHERTAQKQMPEERLQKLLAHAGVASRRKAEELITAGRVSVNGETVTTLGSKADLSID